MKKIICLILSIAMILSLCIITVYAKSTPERFAVIVFFDPKTYTNNSITPDAVDRLAFYARETLPDYQRWGEIDDNYVSGAVSGNTNEFPPPTGVSAHYDEETDKVTLTLENASLYQIELLRDTEIILKGNNVINAQPGKAAIVFSKELNPEKNLTFKSVDGGTLTINTDTYGIHEPFGVSDIDYISNVAFEDANVTIKSTSSVIIPVTARNMSVDGDSVINFDGWINLGGSNTTGSLTVNDGELVIHSSENTIGGENVNVKFNGGFIKLYSGTESPTIWIKSTTSGCIEYPGVTLFEEGQDVIAYKDDIDQDQICLGYDGFSYDTTSGFTNHATVSTFAKLECKEGADQEIVLGNDGTFRFNINETHLTSILIDGKEVDKANYTVKHGSTILTLSKDFLASLDLGKHTVTAKYDLMGVPAEISTTFTLVPAPVDPKPTPTPTPEPKQVPKEEVANTADTNSIGLYVALMSFSVLGTGLVVKKREEK